MDCITFERTIDVNGRKYRQLVESVWDREKKRSRIRVVRHLGRVIERGGRTLLETRNLDISFTRTLQG